MAKSEKKSKSLRKFRAIKRVKNSVKELARLKSVLANERVEMSVEQPSVVAATDADGETMSTNQNEAKVYNSKTKLDANGNYPPWMNQRAIKKIKKVKNKRLKKK